MTIEYGSSQVTWLLFYIFLNNLFVPDSFLYIIASSFR